MGHKSLQEWCLQVIIIHLHRFSYVFNTTTDAGLKRSFEFLQRRYSQQMVKSSTKDSIKEEYFPLLFNKYLRSLDLRVLDRVDWEAITRTIAEIGEGLLQISFSAERYEDHPETDAPPFSNLFPHLKNITILKLEYQCDDEVLKNIAKYCPHLVELNIASNKITNEGLRKYLFRKNKKNEVALWKLRKLDLEYMTVDHDLIELILVSFPLLEVLHCYDVACVLHQMHQKDVYQSSFSSMKKFKLVRLYFEDTFCTHLPKTELFRLCALVCPNVRSLSAEVNNRDELCALAAFEKLESVLLTYSETHSRPNVNDFLIYAGTRLTVLTLTGLSLSVEVLIDNCPLLEVLELDNLSFQPFVKKNTKALEFLKEVALIEEVMNDAATSNSTLLLSSQRLEKIHFVDCRLLTDEIGDAVLTCCTRCPLKEVHFMNPECDFSLLKSILLASRTLKLLHVSPDSPSDPNDVDLLTDVASRLENKPEFRHVP